MPPKKPCKGNKVREGKKGRCVKPCDDFAGKRRPKRCTQGQDEGGEAGIKRKKISKPKREEATTRATRQPQSKPVRPTQLDLEGRLQDLKMAAKEGTLKRGDVSSLMMKIKKPNLSARRPVKKPRPPQSKAIRPKQIDLEGRLDDLKLSAKSGNLTREDIASLKEKIGKAKKS